MPADQKQHYKDLSRKMRDKEKGCKYTSQGIPVERIEKEIMAGKVKEQSMKSDIDNIIRLAYEAESIDEEVFFFIYTNYFCYYENKKVYFPAEISICSFTLKDGVLEENVFHKLIHPGTILFIYS